MKKLMKKFKNERGLTLVELLAVVVILAIIAVIAFVFIGGIIENSKKDAHIANAQQVIAAAKLHEATGGELPVDAEKLQTDNYLDLILDPWTKSEYEDLDDVEVSIDTDGKYTITFEGSECTISNKTETQLSTLERDDLCE